MTNQNNNIPTLLISTVGKKLGVSVETIRLYERKGLILTYKTKGNQRFFSRADIERIKCIRIAINEHKISIEGIRHMQALIPCWEHTRCTMKQREGCPAYHRMKAGCWTYNHKQNGCSGDDCRNCKVYIFSGDCKNIKSLIHNRTASKRRIPRGKKL